MIKKLLLIPLLIAFITEATPQKCSCENYTEIEKTSFQKAIDESDFQKATRISQKLRNQNEFSCKLAGLDQMVVIHMHQGNIDSAKKYLDKQLPILTKVPCNKNAKMEYLTSMAEYYFINNNLKKGSDLTTQALEIAIELKNINRQALLYSYLSTAFSRLEMPEKQIEYARQAVKIIPQINEPRDAVNHIRSIANAYKSNYWKFKNEIYLDTVEYYALEILDRSRNINYESGLIDGWLLISETYSALKKYPDALKYLDSASILLKRSNEVGRKYQYWYKIYFDRSFLYNELKETGKAAQYADSTIKYSLITGEKSIIASAYKKAYEAYRKSGNYENALISLENYRLYQDSISNFENKQIVTELEQKYEKAKNKKTIKELEQSKALIEQQKKLTELNNRFLLIIVFAAILVLILLIILLRQRKIKNIQEIMEAEMRLNRSRMNPHFFFNALTSLQGLAVRENDGKKIATRLFQFSSLMRFSLESTYTNYITIEEEISFLQKYLEVSRFRDENLFKYEIIIDPEIEPEHLQLPSMLIQPFVENSIEHGFKKQDQKGELVISFKLSGQQILVEIMDNGPGLLITEKKENHVSRATQITRDRLYLLNKKQKGNFHFDISNRSDASGVIVQIWLPLTQK